MATKFSPCFCSDEEKDYIDMDLSFSSTNFIYCSPNSSPQSRDFEFQMPSISIDKGTTTSSADELFYKGQLLPLHHPPRLQMVQNHLQTSIATFETTNQGFKEENHPKTPFITSSSSLESCRVSCELNRDDNFIELSAELLISSINKQHPKNSWSKKMKLIKQSILVQKLKASRAYLKSLFSNSACNLEAENLSKSTILKSIDKEGVGNNNFYRRSFSGAIKRHSATNRGMLGEQLANLSRTSVLMEKQPMD
ncbi:putative membrane-associated kinase regulator 3 [Forsythia ovata]|uniref:Membrane-associated kinase regulator 3 n=1 Tax=Forsythia ovata TaxID=205694 RepID=A0ABD1TNZ2_9LAMI